MFKRKNVLSVTLIILTLLPAAAAARPVSDIVNVQAVTVTRSNFLSWSFEVLELAKEDGSCTLPYTRVPRGMKETLCSAQTRGVLEVFGSGKQYPMQQFITRGEALVVLSVLTNARHQADTSMFKDVRNAEHTRAVSNALVLKWMVPQSSDIFGVHRLLKGSEALSLLQAVSGRMPEQVKQSITINLGPTPKIGTVPEQELMSVLWSLIKRDFLHSDTLDEREAAYRAMEGMVESLEDPYSDFFRPAVADDFQAQIKGELSGIGAHIEDKNGFITVVTPLPNSPAERAGITTGDEILEANGVSLIGIGAEKAVQCIRGERGTSVDLKIRRGGTEMMVKVLRDLIVIPEVQISWQNDIAVVQLAQFGETTEKQIRSVLTDIAKKNPRGLILDLRNNGGGLLSAADVVVSNFVPKNSVVALVKSRKETTRETTRDEQTFPAETKMVVLINKGSASASEIVAGALQDYKRATIVGTPSFGKGTVQEVISFRSGEALKLTIAEWFTPLGRRIDGAGVQPDIVVDSDDRDVQLRRALDILR